MRAQALAHEITIDRVDLEALDKFLRSDRSPPNSMMLSELTIVNSGFLWNGQTHRSLSSIARAITGTNWNGPRFFGMREVNGRTRGTGRGA